MKRIAFALGCVVVVAGTADCGKGTLGDVGAAGNSGVLDGIAGATGPSGSGVGGAAGNQGFGGDNPFPGGRGGVTGVGGVSGRGGVTGRGGTGFVSCPPVAPPVCGLRCGNGLLDTCFAAIAPECPVLGVSEECDGDKFGFDSCAARNYGSGTLTCSSVCTIDEASCAECLPAGGSLLTCSPAPITFPFVTSFGIAATDSEVGLAQVDYNDTFGIARLTFARLDPKLAVINVTGLDDSSQPGPVQGNFIDSTVVAANASGWLVAACSSPDIFVHTLDANGKKVARMVVASNLDLTYGCAQGTLSLAQRPGAETLLLWGTSYGAGASVIAADGLSATQPITLLDRQTYLTGYPTAEWVGDAFYAVTPVIITNTATGYQQVVRVQRIAPDGTTTVVADILKDESAFATSLAAGAADLRLIYSGVPPRGNPQMNNAVLMQRLGGAGERNGEPVTLGWYPNFLGNARAVAVDEDTVVLLSGADWAELAILRVDGAGKFVTPIFDIARSPHYGIYDFDMVRRGPELVVAWLHSGPLMLARVTP